MIDIFEKVLAVDGSEQAKRAIPVATELAKLAGGELLIVPVHLKDVGLGAAADVAYTSSLPTEPQNEGARLLQDTLDQVQQAGGATRTELRVFQGDDVAGGSSLPPTSSERASSSWAPGRTEPCPD